MLFNHQPAPSRLKSKRSFLYCVEPLNQGWPTFHLPCVNFLLYGFRCATISINPDASISLPCRVCLQKQIFVRGCKLRVITTRLQCPTSNHAMRHLMAHAPQLGHPCPKRKNNLERESVETKAQGAATKHPLKHHT